MLVHGIGEKMWSEEGIFLWPYHSLDAHLNLHYDNIVQKLVAT